MFILDTDVGLDDATAILLGHNEGIKLDYYLCTEGNTSVDNVIQNVCILDKYFGLKAQIVKGCENHLSQKDGFYGEDGFGNMSKQVMEDLHMSSNDIRTNLSYEEFKQKLLLCDSITYIAIGPLITLSDLIQDERIKNKIGNVYIMGGGIQEFNAPDASEFNFHENPKAVKNVLSSGLNVTLFPLDLTIQQRLNISQIQELENTGKYPEYIKMFKFVKKQTLEYDHIDGALLHDTFPMLYCVYPDKFNVEDVNIQCDENGHLDIVEKGYPIHLVTGVDSSLLYDCLKKAFI